jgi:hypothetical protein
VSAPTPSSDGVVERTPDRTNGPPSRYDLVLAVIPVVFVVAAVVGTVGPMALHQAMLAAGVVAAAAVTDVLFVNPPRDPT